MKEFLVLNVFDRLNCRSVRVNEVFALHWNVFVEFLPWKRTKTDFELLFRSIQNFSIYDASRSEIRLTKFEENHEKVTHKRTDRHFVGLFNAKNRFSIDEKIFFLPKLNFPSSNSICNKVRHRGSPKSNLNSIWTRNSTKRKFLSRKN